MNVSDKAIKMIMHHEGLRLKPYRCPAKLWTIGVGHVLYPDQGKIPLNERDSYQLRSEDNRVFTQEEVNNILKADLRRFEQGVSRYITVELSQGMFDALVSFSFNVGLGTLQRSTLRMKLNRGDKEGAAEELMKYCMAGGKVLRGLQNRRIDEKNLFLS